MQKSEQTLLATLLVHRARLSERHADLLLKSRKLRKTLDETEAQIVLIENEIRSAQFRNGDIPSPIQGSPSKRTVGVLKAWAALHQAIFAEENDGLANATARRAIQIAIPGTPDATCRSYLHRFSKSGHIAQRNGRWFLLDGSQSLGSLSELDP